MCRPGEKQLTKKIAAVSAKIEAADKRVLKAKFPRRRAIGIREYADRKEQLQIKQATLEAQLCAGVNTSP